MMAMCYLILSVIFLVAVTPCSCSTLLQEQDSTLGLEEKFPAKSCQEIYDQNPISHNTSGYYWITSVEETIKVIT